ncbi:MAG: hypothetical protein WC426_04630 [Sulfuriferula sp.]
MRNKFMESTYSVLKAIYAAVGEPYPLISLVIVSLLGAFGFGVGWLAIGNQYHEEVNKQPSHGLSDSMKSGDGSVSSSNQVGGVTAGTINIINTIPMPSHETSIQKNDSEVKSKTPQVMSVASAKQQGSVGIKADGVNGLYMEGNTFVGYDTPMDIRNSNNVTAKGNKMVMPNKE